MKTIRKISLGVVLTLWLGLALAAWFSPAKEISESERRDLARLPQLSGKTVLSGSFMTDFESYTLDQFPLRDTFRRIKALFHYNALGQLDNNDIYIADDHAVGQEYPLDEASVRRAASRLTYLYEKYLQDVGSVVMAVVPDKGYYLGDGHLQLDVDGMMQLLEEQMPWAIHVDLRDDLAAEDYYRTDTHWRQEKILDAADALCEALGSEKVDADAYAVTELERPFYGVYYGQAALAMDPDVMAIMESDLLRGCTTYVGALDMKTGQAIYEKLYDGVYDREKFDGKDMYEGFLSGTQGIVRIDNPNAQTDRELILVRDSFGSAMAPLLAQGYRSVMLVDIRAVQIDLLGKFIEFEDRDVLFLFSALVLNNSSTLK